MTPTDSTARPDPRGGDQRASGARATESHSTEPHSTEPHRTGTILPGPATLYRIFATAEMFTWALLIIAMVLKYTGLTDVLMPTAGGLHGFVFLCYCVVSVGVWINQRWGAGRGIAAVGLAAVPFATVPFERFLQRRGEPDRTWRLVDGRDEPQGFWELFEAWFLRNVVLAAALVVAVVAAVFVLLLQAGPPGQWFG